MANSLNFNRHSGKPVHVLYMDHIQYLYSNPVLYKEPNIREVQYLYSNPVLYKEPNIREVLGWIIGENEKAIWVLCDKSVKPLSYERITLEYSGFLILKSTVLAIEKLDLPLPIRYTTEKSTKTKVNSNAVH